MSNDLKKSTEPGALAMARSVLSGDRGLESGSCHGAHRLTAPRDEWERRMKQLNPHWQPYRASCAEIG